MSVFDDGGPAVGAGPVPASTGQPDVRMTDEQRAVLSAYAEMLGADVVLDREFTDEQLENSPYRFVVDGGAPVDPSEFALGPLEVFCSVCHGVHQPGACGQ